MDKSFFISLTRHQGLNSRIVIDQNEGRVTITDPDREREREREWARQSSVNWEVERSRLTEPLSFQPDLYPGS